LVRQLNSITLVTHLEDMLHLKAATNVHSSHEHARRAKMRTTLMRIESKSIDWHRMLMGRLFMGQMIYSRSFFEHLMVRKT